MRAYFHFTKDNLEESLPKVFDTDRERQDVERRDPFVTPADPLWRADIGEQVFLEMVSKVSDEDHDACDLKNLNTPEAVQ